MSYMIWLKSAHAFLESILLKLCHKPLYSCLFAYDSHVAASMRVGLTHQGLCCWGCAYPCCSVLICLRLPIQVPIIPMSLYLRVVPYEGTKPAHVHRSLHVAMPTCLCVATSHVCQQLAHHSKASIPHIAPCISHKLLMGLRCCPFILPFWRTH